METSSKSSLLLYSMTAVVLLTAHLPMDSAAAPPASCVRPANGIAIDISQLDGIWYEQLEVNYGPLVLDYTCDRAQFVIISNSTAIVAKSRFSRSTGEVSSLISRVTLLDPGLLQFNELTDTSISLHMFPLLLNDDAFVATTCYYLNGKMIVEMSEIQTRIQSVNRTYLQGLLKDVGVEWDKGYYYDNSEYCFTLQRGCH